MNDKKNCIVLYYKSTESWLDKIPKNINVLKKIELKEDDTIENINEKIKDNFCFNLSHNKIEIIIFLFYLRNDNIEKLFYENNFALYLPTIIEVNNEEKLNEINNKIQDKGYDVIKTIKNFITDNNIEFNLDLIQSYFDMLDEFVSFFNRIHENCDENDCKIKNIDNYYQSYKDPMLNDSKNTLIEIKSINNIFGFYSIVDKNEFIFNLEHAFKYCIINTAFNDVINLEPTLPNSHFLWTRIGNYTFKINEYYKLSYNKKEIIIGAILSKKLIRIE